MSGKRLELLDFSAYEVRDTPELRAYKARVVEVARKYARRHHLCSVVDDALREMDALPNENQFVNVKVSTDWCDWTVRVRPGDFKDLDLEGQVKKLIQVMGSVSLATQIGSGRVKLKPESITSMTVIQPPVALSGAVPDDDNNFTFRYTGASGRVAHIFRTDVLGARPLVDPVVAACGQTYRATDLVRSTSHAENRIHESCQANAAALLARIEADRAQAARPAPVDNILAS